MIGTIFVFLGNGYDSFISAQAGFSEMRARFLFLHNQIQFFQPTKKTPTKNVEATQEHFLQNEVTVKYNALNRGLHHAFAFPLLLQCQ